MGLYYLYGKYPTFARAVSRTGHTLRLIRPDDEGKDFVFAAEIALKNSDLTVALDKLTPFLGIVKVCLRNFFGQAAVNYLANSCSTVEMSVDSFQLVIIMLIGMLVGRGVVGVVHAGIEIGIVKKLILVV